MTDTFFGIESPYNEYVNSNTIIVSYPFEKTTSFIKGTKKGPEILLNTSYQIELFDIELQKEPYLSGIHTYKDDKLKNTNIPTLEYFNYITNTTSQLLNDGKFIISLGGEHSISFPIVKSFINKFDDLSVIQFDAHSDLRTEYKRTKFSHACVMRLINELINYNTLGIGIRSQCVEEFQYIKNNNLLIEYSNCDNKTNFDSISKHIDSLSDNIYITFDVDVLDPSIMPDTGTPEPGGLFWLNVCEILKHIFIKKNVVGIDFVEFCPLTNPHASSMTIDKLIYKTIGYKFFLKKH